MRIQLVSLLFLICAPALADEEKYNIHESLKPGDVIAVEVSTEDRENVTTTQDGKSELDSSSTRHAWKLDETILAVKAGSATKARIKTAQGSVDAARKSADADETVTPCPFIREDVILQRHLDDAVTDDFSGEAGPDDTDFLHQILEPDQNWFPDKPVAIGDSWDVSDRIAKQYNLEKGDSAKVDCRLDWVKTIDGRKTAQVTSTGKLVQHTGAVEQSTEQKITMLVDVADGMIVKCDQEPTVTWSTPATEAYRMTGTSKATFHSTCGKKTPGGDVPAVKP